MGPNMRSNENGQILQIKEDLGQKVTGSELVASKDSSRRNLCYPSSCDLKTQYRGNVDTEWVAPLKMLRSFWFGTANSSDARNAGGNNKKGKFFDKDVVWVCVGVSVAEIDQDWKTSSCVMQQLTSLGSLVGS